MNKLSMEADSVVREVSSLGGEAYIGKLRRNATNERYLRDAMAAAFVGATGQCSFASDQGAIRDFIADFFEHYVPTIPEAIRNQVGSTSLAGLLPLYVAARAIDPDLIIESGVFIGSSLHMLATTFKDRPIYGFDINLTRLKVRLGSVDLKQMDWAQDPGLPGSDNTLVFFDDHINCAKRILECRERGVRWAVFDDSPPPGRLHNYRYPALPSVPIIMDERMPDGCCFDWHHQGTNTNLEYVHDARLCEEARGVIRNVASLDVFSDLTGVSSGDKWLVEVRTD